MTNALLVQLFGQLPWPHRWWARPHQYVEPSGVPSIPLRKAAAESTPAPIITAGVHRKGQPPVNMEGPDGGPGSRAIPVDARRENLTITHRYCDHSAAEKDLNAVPPMDRLGELADQRRVGGIGKHPRAGHDPGARCRRRRQWFT